jgi:peptide/nickel transport system permease protein
MAVAERGEFTWRSMAVEEDRLYLYLIRRVVATVPVMVVVGVFVFSLLYLSPGDPAALIAGDLATADDIARIHQKLGLDEPFLLRFGKWVWDLLHGDLGVSIFSNLPVSRMIRQRLEPTLALATTSMLFAVTFAVPMGVIAAWKVGTWIDRAVMAFAVLGFSFPVFVLAYLLIYLFSIRLEWLPVEGYSNLRDGFGPFLASLALPSMALGSIYMALIARITRTSMLEVLSEDYIRTARAKGLATSQVLIRHALKNAGVPIVTVIGVGIGLLIGGVVITESVFGIPGIGRLTVDAILSRDYPVIQGVILVFSGVYVVVNLLVDLSYALIDPRIRY